MSWWFKKSSSIQQQNPSGPSPSHSSSYHHQDSNDSDDGAVNIIISRVNTSSPETPNNNYFNTLINGLKKRLKINSDDNRKYWMPDTCSNECYECGNKFTTIRRRNHCRICGKFSVVNVVMKKFMVNSLVVMVMSELVVIVLRLSLLISMIRE